MLSCCTPTPQPTLSSSTPNPSTHVVFQFSPLSFCSPLYPQCPSSVWYQAHAVFQYSDPQPMPPLSNHDFSSTPSVYLMFSFTLICLPQNRGRTSVPRLYTPIQASSTPICSLATTVVCRTLVLTVLPSQLSAHNRPLFLSAVLQYP